MTTAPENPGLPGEDPKPAEVIPLRPAPEHPAPEDTGTLPAPNPVPAPVSAVDGPDLTGQRRPIIPVALQRGNLRGTVEQTAGAHAYRAAYHGVRLPWHTVRFTGYAARGVYRIGHRLLVWWHWPEGWVLESEAVAAGRAGHNDAIKAHREGKETRGARGRIIGASLAGAAIAAIEVARFAPAWVWPVAAAGSLPFLIWKGRPIGQPLIPSAIIPPKYEPPTPQVITRALGSIGNSAISQAIKDGTGLTFLTDVYRDGEGWGCDLDLPHGVTARMILQRREQFASGLRRPLSATWPEGVPAEHEGRLRVWIGFTDLSKAKPKSWPLLKAGTADVFGSLPFGTDPRGRPVTVPMFEVNWLMGAAPGQGKTNAVRVLACGTALDPVADLWIHELAGKGDLEPLAKVCHRYTSGLDDESIAYTAASLHKLREELERRSTALKKTSIGERRHGKVTRDMALQRRLGLRPIVCIIDEAQNLFMHPEYGPQAADDAAYVIRLGRAYGIILVLATQRPDSKSMPTAVTGNITMRFCLRVPSYVENDLILGTSAHQNGYRATVFRAKTDAGMGWLKGDSDPQVVKTYEVDLVAAERVAARARAMRQQAGVLSGYAIGEDDTEPPRSFLADVLTVFGADPKLYRESIADRLRERIPGAYADITPDAVASQLRALHVTVKDVRESGGRPLKGCERSAVEAALDGGQ